MAIYAGFNGRVILGGPNLPNEEEPDQAAVSYNLLAHKYTLTVRSQEDDVTTAQDIAQHAGRLFVASNLPRIDVVVEGFWTSTNNPFGNPTPLAVGFNYDFTLFFDKNSLTANVIAEILVLGCEITGSVRDVVRFTFTGVINGAMIAPTNAQVTNNPNSLPTFFPLQ